MSATDINDQNLPVDFRYRAMVAALAKDPQVIVAQMTPQEAHAMHMAIGVSGEAGKLLDAVKKLVVYNKPLDMNNLVEELGDIEFYLQGLRDLFGITRRQVLEANIAKLSVRYAEGKYTDAAAAARADKVENVKGEGK